MKEPDLAQNLDPKNFRLFFGCVLAPPSRDMGTGLAQNAECMLLPDLDSPSMCEQASVAGFGRWPPAAARGLGVCCSQLTLQ